MSDIMKGYSMKEKSKTTTRHGSRGALTSLAAAFALLAACLLGPSAASAQWTTSGTNTTTTNNVGVGASSPVTIFQIRPAANVNMGFTHTNGTEALITAFNDANSASVPLIIRGASIRFQDGTLAERLRIGAGAAFGSGYVGLTAPTDGAIFQGNVGVGTSAPGFRFEVLGASSRNTMALTGDGDSVGFAGLRMQALTTTNIANNRTSAFVFSMRKDTWYGGDGSGPSFVIETATKGGGFAAPFLITPTNDIILNSGRGAGGPAGYVPPYGNVGIGTHTPAHKLDVAGNVNAAGLCLGGTCKTTWAEISGTQSQWTTSGSNIYLNSGSVGVGTNAPVTRLHVGNEIVDDASRVYDSNALMVVNQTPTGSSILNDPKPVLYLGRQGTAAQAYGAMATFSLSRYENAGTSGVGSRTRLDIGLTHDSFSDAGVMTLLSNGNVGLGTGAPASLLNLVGPNAALTFGTAGAADSSSFSVAVTASGANTNSGNGRGLTLRAGDSDNAAGKSGGSLTLNPGAPTAPATGYGNVLMATAGGNVGIGTSAPASKLYVGSGTPAVGALPGINVALGSASYVTASNGPQSTFMGSDGSPYGIVGTLSNHPLGLRANNTLAMTLMPDGKVGIGTAAPGQKLDVAGNVNAAGLCLGGTCKTTWAEISGSGSQWTNSGSDIYFSAGSVGVGTNSPGARLDVGAGAPARGGHTDLLIGRGADNAQMEFYGPTKSTAITHDEAAGGLIFYTNGPSFSPSFFIGHAGNVGVGTTAPAQKLHVFGGNVFHQFSSTAGQEWGFYTSVRNNHFSSNLYFDGQWKMLSAGKGATISTAPLDGTAFRLLADNNSRAAGAAATFSELMTVTMDGKVGIGNAAPAHKLDVAGNVNVAGLCLGGTCKTTWAEISGTGGSAPSGWTDAGATVSVSNASANVGIGTASPRGKLEVAGGPIFLGDMGQAAWGNAVMRGRVISANNNLHLSPPGGAAVYIDSNFREAGGPTGTVNLHVSGDVTVGGNITAKYQDLAEWVPSTQKLAAGTVVVLDKTATNHVLASSNAYDTKVAGVVSAQPGVILGVGGEGKLMVATTGRVKIKVDAARGPIEVGDLLVTSDVEGVAMKSVPVELGGAQIHRPGTIIGKALEPLAKGKGEILVLLSLQ